MKPKDVKIRLGFGFIADGQLFMTRCFECGHENWALAVATGKCAWCLYDGYKDLGLVDIFIG
jgi:hypothetical protein